MYPSAHEAEASCLDACRDDAVRLRLSWQDRLWAAARWTLGLAGAVVVLWIGAAFLAAAPAAAAVAAPMAAAQGLQKGGTTRPMSANDDGDSGDSDSDDSDDSGDDDSDSDDSSDDDSSDDDSSDDDSSDDSDSHESKKEKKEKKDSDEKDEKKDEDSDDEDSDKKDRRSGKKDNSSDKDSRSEERSGSEEDSDAEDSDADEQTAKKKDSAAKESKAKEAKEGEDSDESTSEDTDRGDADRKDDRDSEDDARTAGSEKSSAAAGNDDTDSDPTDTGKPSRSDRQSSDGDEVDDEENAASSAGDADADTEDEPTRRDREDGTSTVGTADDDATEDDASEDDAVGRGTTTDGGADRDADRDGSVRRSATQTADSGGIAGTDGDASDEEHRGAEEDSAASDDSATGDEDDSSLNDEDSSGGSDVSNAATVRAAQDGKSATTERTATGSIRSAELSDAGSRAPPGDTDTGTDTDFDTETDSDTGQVSLLRTSEDADADDLRADCDDDCPVADRNDEDGRDDEDDDESDDSDSDDDSAEHVEKVLEDRLEVDKSADALEETKKKVESGTASKLEYDKQAAEHRKREQDYESERSELSDDRAELIDEVVDGHRELSDREQELAAAGEDASADEDDEKPRDRDVAEYEKRRDEVYEATEELMDATDNEIDVVSEDDLDGEGSVSGCGSSGAFTGCGAATEDDEGNRDSDRCLSLSGGCTASSRSGDSEASASCDGSGCESSAAGRGDRGEATRASARCTGECGEQSRAGPDGASAECASRGGSCTSDSAGKRDDHAADRAARTVSADDQERGSSRSAGNGAARCQGGDCATSTSVELDEEGEARSEASVDCGRGCTGSAHTDTEAARDGGARTAAVVKPVTEQAAGESAEDSVAGDSVTSGSARCTTAGGDCTARSESRADDDEGATGRSVATAEVGCADGKCSGNGAAETDGRVVGAAAVTGGPAPSRDTSASTTCQATAGSCAATSGSQVGEADADRAAESVADGPVAGRELVASSTANAQVTCEDARCAGSANATTSGAAAGDVPGVRSSTGSSDCTVHGAGGGCGAGSDTSVSDRQPTTLRAAAVTGPVSVSTATATVTCSGGAGTCGGTTSSATSARDTAVSPHARGSSATADCTVSGGGCGGETSSAASSAADFVVTDPATGLPVAGQPTSGPSSTSSSSAAVACPAGAVCSGTAHTGTTAWDGAVAGGAPRTSAGTASCTGGSAGCEARSTSNASTGPGAALDLSSGQPVNAARFPAGPSAASTAGAATACAGDVACTGSAASAASATDPSVSPEPRGSYGDGSCTGVTGGVCHAVTNSGASSDPSASILAPQVAASSTANATVSSGTTGAQAPGGAPQDGSTGPDQPVAPPVPTAPGSSVSAGAPTVPGASSWTMASAALDCAGGTNCAGTARSSASGTDRPNSLSGAGTARGPPADGSSTTASCAGGPSACHARTSSTAGSGQVVADILSEDQIDTAQQLAAKAAQAEYIAALAARVASAPGATAQQKKAATDAATAAREAATAAQQAIERASTPVTAAPTALARSEANAQCGAAPCGAATSADAAGSRYGQTRTHGDVQCQAGATGCATTMSASTVEASRDGVRSDVVEIGSGLDCPDAGCIGSLTAGTADQGGNASAACPGACQAGATVSTSVAAVPGGLDRLTSTDAFCAGAGCRTHTDGRAEIADVAGTHTATSRTDCTAATECAGAGSVRVAPLQAEAAATCQAGAGGSCGHSFAASSHAAGATAGHSAVADAAGARSGTNGGGQVQTFAQVITTANGAQAAAGCVGIAECRRSYHAHSEASAGYGSMHATGFADESDARTGEGSGGVATVAGATAGPGGAYAYGFCSGSPGASCRQSGEVFVAPPPPPASTIEVEILDDATVKKAEQTGRDLQAGDRVAGRDAPDNHVRTGYQHATNTEPRLEAEAAEAEAAAYQRAINAGASPEGAAKIGTHARQTYLDVVAGKVAPGGKVPAAVTRATTGAMGELNVAVQQQAAFDKLDAARSTAAAAVNNQQAAPGRDVPDNQLGGVIDHANARAATTLQNARDLAAEAAQLGRDYALRHGMDPAQAADFGQDLSAAYVGQVNDIPRQVQLRRQAASLAYDARFFGAPDAARAAEAPVNVAKTDAPDNVLARAYQHAGNGVAAVQAMTADAAEMAARAGITGEFANLGQFIDAVSVRPVTRSSPAESMNAVLGLMTDDGPTADEIAAARTNARYNSDLTVLDVIVGSDRSVPDYLREMRPDQSPLGHLAGVVQLEDDKSEVWGDVFGTAITVVRGEGLGLAPHMTDNQRIHVAEQAAKNAPWVIGSKAQRAGDLALQEAQMRGWSTEGVQTAAAEAYRNTLAREVVRVESAAARIPGYGAEIAADEDNPVRGAFERLQPDLQLRVAAFLRPEQFDRKVIGDYQKLIDFYVPPKPGETAAERTAREDEFLARVENGQVEDFDHMVRYLTDDQRAYLEEINPGRGERLLVGEAEGISKAVDEKIVPVVGAVAQVVGMDEGTSEVLGNAVSDIGTIAANVRLGLYRTAEQAVQSGKYYAGLQLGTTGAEVFDGATKERTRERPGDTWDKAFARKDPLLGNMLVVPTANMARRWAPAVVHGDFDKVVNGDPSKGLTGYREHPVLTFLEDATPFMVAGSVVSGGASLGMRFAAGAASTAARGALLASKAARAGAGRASKLADLGITSVRFGDDLVDVGYLARDLRSVSQNLDHEAAQHLTRAQNLNRYLDLLNPTDRLVDSVIRPVPRVALDQVLPTRAPRIVDQDLLDEVGFGSVDELTAHLRGDERFYVWGIGDNTFLRRAHGDESWLRGAFDDELYDPTTLSMAELKRDIDPKLKPGETLEQAMARVQAAEAEYWPRAEAAYRALPDAPPTINIRVNDAEHPDVAHTLERHGPQVPLKRSDAPEGVRTIQGRISGDAPWRAPHNFSFRWFSRSLIDEVVNRYLQDNWDTIRLDLALWGTHNKLAQYERAVGEGYRYKYFGTRRPDPANDGEERRNRPSVYLQTNFYEITLDLLHPGRGPPVVRVVRAFPNGRFFQDRKKQ